MKINGFSKMSKQDKIEKISLKMDMKDNSKILESFWHQDTKLQNIFENFAENTLSNYYLPYGVIPNVLVNGKNYCVPIVTEESSVVAAASSSAKFWSNLGGFQAEILNNLKIGHVHFCFDGDSKELFKLFDEIKQNLIDYISPLQENMQKRGGGLQSLNLVDKTLEEENYYQIEAEFITCNAMGANFINTILESLAEKFKLIVSHFFNITSMDSTLHFDIIMSILSNYTPQNCVKVWGKCLISELGTSSIDPYIFATKFKKAVDIARVDKYRAVTHNKGIFNGIDGVVLATGNDFRAVEACGHAYAARSGQYRSLSECTIEEGYFEFSMTLPISVGTIGGLTSLHPLAKYSLDLLQSPSAEDLMKIIASVGLAQNFAAIRSLVTSGIQKGHMKMHLVNILNNFQASEEEIIQTKEYFSDKKISFSTVGKFVQNLRNNKKEILNF